MKWWLDGQGNRDANILHQERYRKSRKGRETSRTYISRPEVKEKMLAYNRSEKGVARRKKYSDSNKGVMVKRLHHRRHHGLFSARPRVIRFGFRYEFRNQEEVGYYPDQLFAIPYYEDEQTTKGPKKSHGKFAVIDDRGVLVTIVNRFDINRLRDGAFRREWENVSLVLMPYPPLYRGEELRFDSLYQYKATTQKPDYMGEDLYLVVMPDAEGQRYGRAVLINREGSPVKARRGEGILEVVKEPHNVVYVCREQLKEIDVNDRWSELSVEMVSQLPKAKKFETK